MRRGLALLLVVALVAQPVAASAGVGTTAPTAPASMADDPIDGDCVQEQQWLRHFFAQDSERCAQISKAELENLSQLDADETKVQIYESAAETEASLSTYGVVASNYLNDTRSIALMEAKNRLIRELNNGTEESTARIRARGEISEYYTKKQINLLNYWQVQAEEFDYLRSKAESESNVSAEFVKPEPDQSNAVGFDHFDPTDVYAVWEYKGLSNVTVTLANESTMEVSGLNARYVGYKTGTTQRIGTFDTDGQSASNINRVMTQEVTATPLNLPKFNESVSQLEEGSSSETWADVFGNTKLEDFRVSSPLVGRDLPTLRYLDLTTFESLMTRMEAQNDQIQANFSTFANETIPAIKAGEINASDLIDPYLASREYGASGFQTWAARQLQMLGISNPAEATGSMTVLDETVGVEYDGILMSDGQPEGGFSVGTSYNATNISGKQVLLRENSTRELTGSFTIESATGANGETRTNLSYPDVSYQTSNISEFKQVVDLLKKQNAIIDAQQQANRDTSSGGGGGGGLLPSGWTWPTPFGLPSWALPAAGAFAVLLLLFRN